MVKLVAIDMDGTLLNTQNQISPENQTALQRAIKAGVHVVIASGRSYQDVIQVLHSAGLCIPVISINGAQIHLANGECIHKASLDIQQANAIHQIAKQANIYHEAFTDQGVFPCDDSYDEFAEEVRQGTFKWVTENRLVQHLEIMDQLIAQGKQIDQILQDANVSFLKFLLLTSDHEKLQAVRQQLNHIDQIAVTSSYATNIEVNHADAQKGEALAILAAYLGIPMEQTMAIGDHLNDLSMFRVAGLSVAMGNANLEVVQHCDQRTKTNDEHGVAYAFEQWVF